VSGVDVARGHVDGDPRISVLFVCTHNSARSIMAEALLRQKGGEAYAAYSAGTEVAEVRPLTLQVLREAGIPTDGLRSKSVQEFMGQRFDYVITVCDSARQNCPVFPGEGERFHWGYDDPSAVVGTDEEKLAAFRRVFTAIAQRIDLFMTIEDKRETHGG
jgi:arsenate reductase (thioredoxin)